MTNPINPAVAQLLDELVTSAPDLNALNMQHLVYVTGEPIETVKAAIEREGIRRDRIHGRRVSTSALPNNPAERRFVCHVHYYGLTSAASNGALARRHGVASEYVAAVRAYLRAGHDIAALVASRVEQPA